MFYLALDQSTSATKALLFDEAGQVVDREARDHAQHYPQPGWVEHDADEIWRNTLEVLGKLAERQADRWSDVVSLSITNQRETILIFDRATGEPLHRALVWQCRRGDPVCSAHVAAGAEDLVRSRTGLKIDPYFSGSKLQWFMENRPEIAARVRDGSAVVGTIDTYLIHRLTEGRVLATDSTNASRTLLYNIVDRRWDEQLCALWQIPPAALAEVRDSGADYGTTDLGGAWTRALPIRGVMGDSQAALFAQRCFTPGSAKVTFGTGSSLLLNIGTEPKFSNRGLLTALAWTRGSEAIYAYEGVIISSASTLTWLRDQLGLAATVDELDGWARELPDNGGVYLVPAFTGLGLPHWVPAARASITGLSSHSDKRHVARAAFESIAYQVRDALDVMRDEAGVSLAEVAGDGGPTANDFLMQFTADITGVNLRVATVSESSALGAVMIGRSGVSEAASHDDVDDVIYQPRRPTVEVETLHAGWRKAVSQTLLAGSPDEVPHSS